MTDLETKLAEARERFTWPVYNEINAALYGFDAAANIAREVVAEKDAEIAQLKGISNAKTDDQEFAEYISNPENRREYRKALKRIKESETDK